jgi:hypothetical protein
MAPPRQKSCNACVRAKRRCDVAAPACARCRNKGLQCIYGSSDLQTTSQTHSANLVPSTATQVQYSEIREAPTASQSFIGYETAATMSIDMSSHLDLNETIDWSLLMSNIDDFITPDRLMAQQDDDEPEVVHSGDIYQARVVFCVKQIKTWPRSFCTRCYTGFINPNLWSNKKVPMHLLDAMSACNLYCNKTDDNETWIFQFIGSKAQTLVANVPTGDGWTSPIEHLAAVQALLLYQIIRLFDGDIRQRAEAEAHDGALDLWTEQLKYYSKSFPPRVLGASHMKTAISMGSDDISSGSEWHDWVFNESVRRTLLVSYLLRGTYTFVKMGWDKMSRPVRSCSFTAQAGLWRAQNEQQWQSSREDLLPFEIMVRHWEVEMEHVHPDDLDELGVILYALYHGMDRLREWLERGRLEEYGLS